VQHQRLERWVELDLELRRSGQARGVAGHAQHVHVVLVGAPTDARLLVDVAVAHRGGRQGDAGVVGRRQYPRGRGLDEVASSR